MQVLEGILPVLITPLKDDGSVDTETVKALVQGFVNKGAPGIWVLGTGGEDMCLSMRQRLDVVEAALSVETKNTQLMLGCSFFAPEDSYEFIRETKKYDFAAYHAMPYHPKVSLDQLYSWYERLVKKADRPFWAYTSGNWAQRMDSKFIARVKGLPNICGVKYSTSNIVDLQEVAGLQDDGFQVISAVIKTFNAALYTGCKASTSIEAMLFWDKINEIFTNYKSGNFDAAKAAQSDLNANYLTYPSLATRDNFLRVSEIKHLMGKYTSVGPTVTDYYRQLGLEECTELDDFFAKNESKFTRFEI